MTKLKLGPLIEYKPVKVAVELPGPLHRDLAAYAEVLAREQTDRHHQEMLQWLDLNPQPLLMFDAQGLLLRHGIVYYGGKAWTGAHDRWLRTEAAPRLPMPATRMAFDADYEHALTLLARRARLDASIEEIAANSEFTPIVRRVSCLRGVSTLTGFALAVEIGDWNRFTGNTIGSFVGLVPAEYSSGSTRAQGPITKTGNSHVRRLLVEAAWHHRPRYRVGTVMRSRWELAPVAARVRGDEGNRRLHTRWVGFLARRKRSTVANVSCRAVRAEIRAVTAVTSRAAMTTATDSPRGIWMR